MNILLRLLKWVAREKRVIPDRVNPARPYLTRYYLLGGPGHRWFTLCLHEFHCSDPTGLHDHPFSYLTCVLTGGYWEEDPKGLHWRAPGHLRFRPARSLHRIVLNPWPEPHEAAVHTLFFMGPRVRNWGFVQKDGTWVDHDSYLKQLGAKHARI